MKLPGINYGGRAESLGRHDISLPAREAAAKSQVIGAVEGVAGQIYQDINEREMRRQQAEYNATMLSTEGDVNERINNGERVFGTQEMAYAGADMTQYGDQLEYRDYEAITPFYTSSMTQAHTSAMEKITSPRLRESIENDWKSHLVKGQMKAMSVQNSRHKEATLAQMNGELEIARAAGAVDAADAIIEEQLELNLISPEFARKEKRDTGIRVEGDQYFELLREDNIDGIRNAITRLEMEDKPYLATGGVLNDGDRAKWINRLDGRLKEISSKNSARQLDAAKDYARQRSRGVGKDSDRPDTSGIVDPYRREQLEEAMTTGEMVGEEVIRVKTMTPAQARGYIDDAKLSLEQGSPADDERNYAVYMARVNGYEAVQKALYEDQAKYTAENSPAVRDAINAYENSDGDATARREMTLALKAEQIRMGVPVGKIKYLTKSTTVGLSTQLNRVNSQQRGAIIAQQQAHWGDDWPVVYRQLIQDEVLSGVDGISAGLPVQQHNVMTALSIAQDIPNLEQLNKVGHPDTTKQDWHNYAGVAVQELVLSAPANAQSPMDMLASVERLGRYYSHQYGLSPEDGIELGKKHLIDDRFNFVPQNNGRSLRVPTTHNEGTIEAGLQAIETAIPIGDIAIMSTGTSDDYDRELARTKLLTEGYWETNGDGTGAILKWGLGNPVMREDDTKVEFSWVDITARQHDIEESRVYFGPLFRIR